MTSGSPLTIGVDHVGLTVADLAPTIAFFVEALGWKQIGEDPGYPAVYLSDGTTKVTLWKAWAESPVPADREANIGLHHLALRVASPEALETVFEAVKDFPGVIVEFSPQLNPVGIGPRSHSMVFEPGGNRIEFVQDPR